MCLRCVGCGGALLLASGEREHMIVDGKGRRWRFEVHPYCGPMILRSDGEPASVQPGDRSPFWPAFERWQQRGAA